MDKVPFLTVSEFDSVPKYMRGRMTYDSLNAAVSEYNSALEEKYAFLAKGFQAMGSIKDKKRFKEFRSQVQKNLYRYILQPKKNFQSPYSVFVFRFFACSSSFPFVNCVFLCFKVQIFLSFLLIVFPRPLSSLRKPASARAYASWWPTTCACVHP